VPRFDEVDRRGLFETAIVVAVVVGVLTAALVIATPLGIGAIVVVALVTYVVGLVGALVFLAG
jgi:hypothetical protein